MIAPVVKVRVVITAATVAATSWGVARRPSGVRADCSSCQALSSDFTNSVSTSAGDTDTTRMRGARARASDLVMLSRAALDAQYITLLPIAMLPAAEERLTTTPPPGR